MLSAKCMMFMTIAEYNEIVVLPYARSEHEREVDKAVRG